jgi:DNA-binding MarR family transcriptional regulator
VSKRDDDLAREWQDLMSRYHRLSGALDRALQTAHGISGSEFAVIEQLAESRPDHSLKMHDLGETVPVTQSALSRLVARLEADGLIERSMCTEDRRCVYARLTQAGLTLYRDARPTQREVLRAAG